VKIGAAVAAAVLASATAGAGTLGTDTNATASAKPEEFMSEIVSLTLAARNAQVYDLLHPGHQKLVPRSLFVRCRADPPGQEPTRVLSSAFAGKRYERIDVPLIPQHTSTAVTLKLVVARGELREPATVTVHAVWTGQRWAWYLPAGSIPAFRSGTCPA
jgi:hypothetical protein